MMAYYIGIDPGDVSGIAMLDDSGALIYAEVVDSVGSGTATASEVLRRGCSLYQLGDITTTIVGIEDQFVGVNKRSAVVLARNSGRWFEAASNALIQARIVLVPASKWQSAELGRLARGTTKLAAIAKAKALWGAELREHAADAALLARYLFVEDQKKGAKQWQKKVSPR